MTDDQWKDLVYRIANHDAVHSMVEDAAAHLWKTSDKFRRLEKEAPNYTKFLCEKVAKCPDYTLRKIYREAVLKEHNR